MGARDVQPHLHWFHHKNVKTSALMLNSTSMLATTGPYVLLVTKSGRQTAQLCTIYIKVAILL
jgi:hypothetical protein